MHDGLDPNDAAARELLDEFAAEFELSDPQPTDRLWDDLELDSLGVLMALLWIEDRVGTVTPADAIPELATVADLLAHRDLLTNLL